MRHSLRRATDSDSEAIAGIHGRAWAAGYGGTAGGELDLAHHDALTVVAENEKGELSGFCSVVCPSRDHDAGASVCEVTALFVEPERWRWGIGRALMRTALDKVTGDGYEGVTVWLPEGNDGARAFFANFGFKPDGQSRPGQARLRLTLA